MLEPDPCVSSILTRAIDFSVTFATGDSEWPIFRPSVRGMLKKMLMKKIAVVKKKQRSFCTDFSFLFKEELLQSFYVASAEKNESGQIHRAMAALDCTSQAITPL